MEMRFPPWRLSGFIHIYIVTRAWLIPYRARLGSFITRKLTLLISGKVGLFYYAKLDSSHIGQGRALLFSAPFLEKYGSALAKARPCHSLIFSCFSITSLNFGYIAQKCEKIFYFWHSRIWEHLGEKRSFWEVSFFKLIFWKKFPKKCWQERKYML